MSPTLKPDSVLLGSKLIKPKPGHVSVIDRSPVSIKRIKRIDDEGIWVEGDNSEASTDSRDYGYIDPKAIKAIVFMKLL